MQEVRKKERKIPKRRKEKERIEGISRKKINNFVNSTCKRKKTKY